MANRLLLELKKRLGGRVVIVGIGNVLRGDDGAGPELIEQLKNSKLSTLKSKLSLIDVARFRRTIWERLPNISPIQ